MKWLARTWGAITTFDKILFLAAVGMTAWALIGVHWYFPTR